MLRDCTSCLLGGRRKFDRELVQQAEDEENGGVTQQPSHEAPRSSPRSSSLSPQSQASRGVRASSAGAEESARLVDNAAEGHEDEFAASQVGAGGDHDAAGAVDPAWFAGHENPDTAAALYRDHVRCHQDTQGLDAFGTRLPTLDTTGNLSDQASPTLRRHSYPITTTIAIPPPPPTTTATIAATTATTATLKPPPPPPPPPSSPRPHHQHQHHRHHHGHNHRCRRHRHHRRRRRPRRRRPRRCSHARVVGTEFDCL
jgi:hypothetical protein